MAMRVDGADKATDLAKLSPAARSLLSSARAGKPAPVSLICGEPSLVTEVANAFVDALVPAPQRSVNLEVYDGRATPLVSVLDTLRTRGLFASAKVVWVRELPLLAAGEKRSEVLEAILKAIADERMERRVAVRRLHPLPSHELGEALVHPDVLPRRDRDGVPAVRGEGDAAAVAAGGQAGG